MKMMVMMMMMMMTMAATVASRTIRAPGCSLTGITSAVSPERRLAGSDDSPA
jgi:hypothetical protein